MKSKKILMGVIIILVIIIITNLTLLFLRKGHNEKREVSTIVDMSVNDMEIPKLEGENTTEITEDATITDLQNDDSIETEENTEIIPTKNVEITTNNNVSKSYTQDTAKQVVTSNVASNAKRETQENKPIQNVENTPVQQEQNNVQNVTKEEPKSTNIPVEKPQENISVVETKEEFRVNNSLISKIQSIINSNPSSMMQEYGYNIVVDSSITDKTTGFSFTETRVKNAISYSMGTIRIYARDYYKNGNLMWSECFIL